MIIYSQKQGSILWSRLYDPNFVLPSLDSQQNHLEPRSITTGDDTKVSESPSSNQNEIRKSTESVLATVSVGQLWTRERERQRYKEIQKSETEWVLAFINSEQRDSDRLFTKSHTTKKGVLNCDKYTHHASRRHESAKVIKSMHP